VQAERYVQQKREERTRRAPLLSFPLLKYKIISVCYRHCHRSVPVLNGYLEGLGREVG
jgi:hypothetical protein